ncbi:MAG: AarF/ABC1/UbiB kinase family protein, partial [Pseudomonadota bacterium]
PIAAASIGQVHRARTRDGRDLAIKVQYPGVARSIDSDIDNVVSLIRLAGLAPQGLNLDPLVAEAKRQLAEEADYALEAENLKRFAKALGPTPGFSMPEVQDDLTAPTVLAMTRVAGGPLEAAETLTQDARDAIATRLLTLTLREIFEFTLMQSDPNFANYRYDADTGTIGLLDFGAVRPIPAGLAKDYARLLRAGLSDDFAGVEKAAEDIGLLSARTAPQHRRVILAMMRDVLAVMLKDDLYDFGRTDIVALLRDHGMALAGDPGFADVPPVDVLYLQRKVAGMYLICRTLRARVQLRALLEDLVPRAA